MVDFLLSNPYLAIIGGVICWEASWGIYCRYFHPLQSVPGPFWVSVSRLWTVYHASGGNMEYVQRRLHKEYGYLVRIAPNEIICSDPRAITTIYETKSDSTRSDVYDAWAPPSKTGYPGHFPTRDEKMHTEHRRFVNSAYSMSSVLASEENIDSCTHHLFQALRTAVEENSPVDLGRLLNMYTFDVLGELFYGQSFGMLETRSDVGSYMESIESLLPTFTIGGTLPSYLTQLYLFFSISFSSSLRGAEAIRRRTRELAEGLNNKLDIMRKMLEIVKDRGQKVNFTLEHILVESQSSLFAGADTTSIALTSTLYYLMQHPACFKKLVAEINAAFTEGKLSDPVTYKEASTMRLRPGVGFHMPRVVPRSGATVCGTFIPGGYRVGINPAVVQYDRDIFGLDAEYFNPDRWLGENVVEMERTMMVFGAGKRTCMGKHIALAQVYKVIPQLLRRFHMRLVKDQEWETKNFWFKKPVDVMEHFPSKYLTKPFVYGYLEDDVELQARNMDISSD
ncbi:hypothetical protein BDW74DRAFT_167491 [Aspergillus multicolor]|uniref:cytochrome P450 n=1 Tax=Aspergillus multicolor TaxID=41759 RepID=UPI003CCCF9EC